MRPMQILFIALIVIFTNCSESKESISEGVNKNKQNQEQNLPQQQFDYINSQGTTITTRFNPPQGFERVEVNENSFGHYLRKIPLKPHGAIVKYHNGYEKDRPDVYAAVVDLPIGTKNLHQCADAVMRLKADYHYSREEWDSIHFNLTNGFNLEYRQWKEGKRLKVDCNKTFWYNDSSPSTDKDSYWKYLETVWSFAGTLSLSKELKPIAIENMQIGDVFIQGASPGHAVIVVDVAINKTTDQKVFMLAQSYMPAQETQILINPRYSELGVWYSSDFEKTLITPEWNFRLGDLKRF